MSLIKVAAEAGVSPSTVSRVLNDQAGVAPETVESVRRAMQKVSFAPRLHRRSRNSSNNHGEQARTIAFLVFGTSGTQPAPAFTHLLRGVSIGAREHNLDLFVSFVSNPDELPRRVLEQRVGGLLLHGEQPSQAVQAELNGFPTVWLMANRFPPRWGDQVMPDNSSIGRFAADYLLQQGCTSVAYLSASAPSWGLEVRELAFGRQVAEAGGQVHILSSSLESPSDFWQFDASAARVLTEKFLQLPLRPQGIFVAEDRHVSTVHTVLNNAGLSVGPGKDVCLVSCNNEMPYLDRLNPAPASLDIRAESIGQRSVEQLLWRLQHPNVEERIRKMVEPALIRP